MLSPIVAIALTAALAAAEPEMDDPRGRLEARIAEDGVRPIEVQLRILDAARSEALRYSALAPARVAGSAWVNIGPATADFEQNGVTFFKVDSGRARKILVDPRDANVVYLATSGGGVWKTYDALAPISATSGPHWQPITETIGSLSVGMIAMNPRAPDSLLLGLGDPFDVQTPGFYSTANGGATWDGPVTLTGTYTASGTFTANSVRDIQFDPGGAIVFAATDAGLFRHAAGGVGPGWSLVDLDALTHAYQDCTSIASAGPHTWLAACCENASCIGGTAGGGRLWRSVDDGASWSDSTARLPGAPDLERMTLATASAPSAGGGWRAYLLAANSGNNAQKDVYRSNDGGATWSSLSMGPSFPGNKPVNPTSSQPDLDFLHGQAFYNHMLVVDPANPDTLFIGGNLASGRSRDGGATWTVMTDWLPAALPPTTGGLGDAQYVHADWHAATIAHAGGAAYFYGGTDGGIFRAVEPSAGGGVLTGAPGSVAWEDRLNRGVVTHLIYHVATGRERPATACTSPAGVSDIVLGGFQDNGTRLRTTPDNCTPSPTVSCTNYTGFSMIFGGDGFGVGVGCVPGGAMGSNLVETYVSQINTSTDGGKTFVARVQANGTGLVPPITLDPRFTFHMRIAADLTSDRTYLTPLTSTAQLGYVYRSQDGGASWNQINGTIHLNPATRGTANVFANPARNIAAHLRSAGVYATVSGGRAYVTADGGANWFEGPVAYTTNGTNYLAMHAVAFDPGDATGNTVWMGSTTPFLNDFTSIPSTVPLLYKCTGAAGAAPACVGKANGIPAGVPINVINVDPGDSATIYVGTEIGMYRSIDGGTSFSRMGALTLPMVSVTDIAIDADGSAMRISTFGRGFWEIYPRASAPAGVAGNGDLDRNQIIDAFDLVRESALLFADPTQADYDPVGNLVGAANVIDGSDVSALTGKLGGRP